MRKILASLCLCATAYCFAAEQNTAPFAFRMHPQDAANALGVPIHQLRGRHRSEVFVTVRTIPVPRAYPVDEATALQFRNGRLTGWKQDWRVRHAWY
jgi:hypothetical protein